MLMLLRVITLMLMLRATIIVTHAALRLLLAAMLFDV